MGRPGRAGPTDRPGDIEWSETEKEKRPQIGGGAWLAVL